MSSVLQYDVISYGVKVPGQEGRAGMVAIRRVHGPNMLDIKLLSKHINDNLPKYARPLFLRIIHQSQDWELVTSTLKLRKLELQR